MWPPRYILIYMVNPKRPHRAFQQTPAKPATILLPIKCPPDVRQRLKIAAAEDGLTYAQLLVSLLDLRDDRHRRQRAAQASPLHRPRAETA
ncbi:hypothetical protein AU098_gp067 [Mycobacterium phage Apizium]|uniref:Ribbon-helix-helix DNA binding domain protein n=41 Tax=Pegunavirus TaxID=1623295 RepID=Q716K8_9CAUD|nr:hypothetical protein PBI_PG1_67 [Mycobacterium phage PG1]YP_009005713.1 hypothetical protein PBI_SUFFOLK_66 [Mycobacterium phage Suffolk]YP_009018381.1 hypothetical protein CL95_gp068 [Mycobacterium phage JacAttac]YP_009043342.1 hypothetical protein HL05_gp067 [Mycobacterium phage Manad]YP_009189304.1 gp66 [Mycobacterium phage ShiVal]YP_009190124.1 hypothetical protein AU110_gp068 [Mycobacterium phage Badfish]YP_009191060.1 hypothetical protein AU159_gp066 [Mycobacterium phage Colbert]YP_